MDVLIPVERDETYTAYNQADVLQTLVPLVEGLMDDHLRKRKLWFPNDFLPADEQMDEDQVANAARIRERARSLPDAVRAAVALNLLTEEGLPHFHRVISSALGEDNPWGAWNLLWTGEEERHGAVIHDYVRDTRLFKMREIEMMQYSYLHAGFRPKWESDPYLLFVYTTLQERATQYSHRGTGRVAGDDEPTLKGILSAIAADEAKHYRFYRGVFKGILECDADRALVAALAIMPSLEMPGSSIPHYFEMAEVTRRIGIYSAWDYKEIVEEATNFWGIADLEGLSPEGRQAQEKIMAIPARLQRVAERTERRNQPKTFAFDFTYGREFTLQ